MQTRYESRRGQGGGRCTLDQVHLLAWHLALANGEGERELLHPDSSLARAMRACRLTAKRYRERLVADKRARMEGRGHSARLVVYPPPSSTLAASESSVSSSGGSNGANKDLRFRLLGAADNARFLERIRFYYQNEPIGHPAAAWVGVSEAASKIRGLIKMAAENKIPVLITGESGTGKEDAAKLIAALSSKYKEFWPANVAAFSDTLVESELFGHEKGSFTGAVYQHAGLFEAAKGGTVFLDEIGDAPWNLQTKLLRVLDRGVFRRVGGTRELQTDVRIIAATNRDLVEAVRAGKFRKDLFYRLCGICIVIPPLRVRREDILELAAHILGSRLRWRGNVSLDFLRAIYGHEWPGNARELNHVLEVATIMARAEGMLEENHLIFPPAC